MSATDELRRLLDERGEYYKTSGNRTWWGRAIDVQTGKPINVFHNQAQPMGEDRLFVELQLATPEQAIAATLGAGTCHNASKVMDEHGQARFACSECGAWIDSRMLWNPEYRNGESPWVSDCKLNYCPNCGRKVVDE